jgi:hypothetical protein
MKMYAKKRSHNGLMKRIDEEISGSDGNTTTLADILGEEDENLTSIHFKELMIHLEKTLEPC